jgi:hypothetical protein
MWHPPFVPPLPQNHHEMHFLSVTEFQMLEEPICSNNPENAIHETKLFFSLFFKNMSTAMSNECEKPNNFQEHAVDPLSFEYAIKPM